MTEGATGDPYRPVPSLGPPPRRVPRSVALYVIIGNIGLQCLSIVGSVTSIALYVSLSQGTAEWEFVLADLIPLLLLGLFALSPPTERRSLELLRTGVVAAAKIVKQEKIAEGRRWRWVLTFEFENEAGERRQFVYTSSHPGPVMDDAEEQVLHDPRGASGVQLVDDLPGAPRVGPDGQIAAKSIASLAVVLLAPVLVVVTHLAILIRLITG